MVRREEAGACLWLTYRLKEEEEREEEEKKEIKRRKKKKKTNQGGGMDDELRSGGGRGGALILALIGWVWQHRVIIIHSYSRRASCWDRGPRAEGEDKRHAGRLIVLQAETQILCFVRQT